MIPVASYAAATDEQLLTELATLTKDLGDARRDLADQDVLRSVQYWSTWADAVGESVTGRNKIADEFVKLIDQERYGLQAQVAVLEDQMALVRTILDYRTAHGATGQ